MRGTPSRVTSRPWTPFVRWPIAGPVLPVTAPPAPTPGRGRRRPAGARFRAGRRPPRPRPPPPRGARPPATARPAAAVGQAPARLRDARSGPVRAPSSASGVVRQELVFVDDAG